MFTKKKKKRKTGIEERRHNVYCSHPFVIVAIRVEYDVEVSALFFPRSFSGKKGWFSRVDIKFVGEKLKFLIREEEGWGRITLIFSCVECRKEGNKFTKIVGKNYRLSMILCEETSLLLSNEIILEIPPSLRLKIYKPKLLEL